MRFRSLRSVLAIFALGAVSGAFGQTAELPSRDVSINVDSGFVTNKGSGPAVVFTTTVRVPRAPWLRLQFANVTLAGDPSADNASYLRLTSMRDAAVQRLNSRHVFEWANTSAYFNGDSVRVELIAYPDTGPNRIRMTTVTAGELGEGVDSICDGTDLRTLSNDPRSARLLPVGCSAWMINDLNRQFATAGHCGPTQSGSVVQFNVPLSNSNGSLNHPPPSDQYVVDLTSVQRQSGGVGLDWSYFGVNPNSNTFLQPFQVQGSTYILAASAPAPSGQLIRITGYGTVSSPVSPTWNQVQKTHAGPYTSMSGTTVRYRTDTTGGNSGSPVIDESTGLAIGVHTHGGCTSTGGSNAGTAIHHAGWQNALANPLRVCRSGMAAIAPPVFAAGDFANNFGTVAATNGAFGKVAQVGAGIQGLAYDSTSGNFYAIDTTRRLFTINATTSAVADLGIVSGTTLINGLAFDPGSATLYGIRQSDGQLYRINTVTLVATTIGGPQGGTVGGIDYDAVNNVLYGLDDAGGTKLIRINTTTGAHTLVGGLGLGGADCNGLAFNSADGMLYTINAGNQSAYRINPTTGAATLVGGTGGLFGSGFGMAALSGQVANSTPTHFSIITGVHLGGGLAELAASDDLYFRVREVPPVGLGLPSVRVGFQSAVPTFTLSELKFRLEASVTASPASSVMQQIELYNHLTNTWEIVDSRSTSATDLVVEVTPSGNPNRFVQAVTGRVDARISYYDPGTLFSFGWQSRIDHVLWTVRD